MCVVVLPAWPLRMGGVTSRRRRHEDPGAWDWHGAPGEHSGYPQDLVPYPGEELLYCFIDIITKYKIMRNTMNLGHSVVTTNIEEYLEDLRECYREGFVLNHFVRVPCVKATIEVQDWAEPYPYQAIFSRPAYRHPGKNHWELIIEKKILSTRLLATADFEEKSDLINTIHEKAEEGARLVCAQPVGYVRSGTTNTQYAVMGVDLFFNVPRHPNPMRYCYHPIKVPVRYVIVPDASQTIQQIESDADWMGQLKLFLDKGWKLVDICMDTTALADAFGLKEASKTIDTIWIFEKPFDKIDDFEPAYEGVIIEYFHKSKLYLKGERPCKDWRPVIAGMGVTGWELVTIIQTPYLTQPTFTTYAMKLLMVFQRPYIAEHQDENKKIRLKLAQEEYEREQGKYAIIGLTLNRSSSVPGTSAHNLHSDKSPSPRHRRKQHTPNLKRFVYADNAVVPTRLRNGSVKRAESSDILDYRSTPEQLERQGTRFLNPQPSYQNVHPSYREPQPTYEDQPSLVQNPSTLHQNPQSLHHNPPSPHKYPHALSRGSHSPRRNLRSPYDNATSPHTITHSPYHEHQHPQSSYYNPPTPYHTQKTSHQTPSPHPSPSFYRDPLLAHQNPTSVYEETGALYQNAPMFRPGLQNTPPNLGRFPTTEEEFELRKFPTREEDFT